MIISGLEYIINSKTKTPGDFHTVNVMNSKLRKPNDDEIDTCASLIFTSGPDLYRYIFANQEPNIYDYIKFLCNVKGSLFSTDNIVIEEEEDSIVRGLILAYPVRDMVKISVKMLKSIPGLMRISGFEQFSKIMLRMGLNRYFPGTSHDELFISNLAVLEEYRGKGIGFTLLQKAEDMALANNLRKLSLYVEIDNSNAIRIYEKYGFIKEKESILPEKYHRHNLFGFYKMVKVITPAR